MNKLIFVIACFTLILTGCGKSTEVKVHVEEQPVAAASPQSADAYYAEYQKKLEDASDKYAPKK